MHVRTNMASKQPSFMDLINIIKWQQGFMGIPLSVTLSRMGLMPASILILVLCFPSIALSASFARIRLPNGAFGPDSLAFESADVPFYAGGADGTVLKYRGPVLGWSTFASTSPNRSPDVCDNNKDPEKGPICGRPMGLGYDPVARVLYIVDAYHGLLAVNSDGGRATLIANSAEGQAFKSLNALDIDPSTRNVFFTDASAAYDLRNVSGSFINKDSTGRLMKYDPRTKEISVLMRNLSGAVGVGVSADGAFVLVSETITNRTQRFWLRGPKANTAEIFLDNIAMPNNIKRTVKGQFWIAATTAAGLPIGVRVDGSGRILETIYLEQYGYSMHITEIQASGGGGRLYVCSRYNTDFIGVIGPN